MSEGEWPEYLPKKQGIYGETEVSPYGVKIRPATSMESIELSKQPEFIYFIPFFPLAICPGFPDPAAEYAYAKNKEVTIVQWETKHPLIPKLESPQLTTASIFGMHKEVGDDFINFASGMVRQDQETKLAIRLLIDKVAIVEPYISRSRPAENILSRTVDVYTFGIQTAEATYRVQPDAHGAQLLIVKTGIGDKNLWKMVWRFWTGNPKPMD